MSRAVRRRQLLLRLVRASLISCALLILLWIATAFVHLTVSSDRLGGSVGVQIARGGIYYTHLDNPKAWTWPQNSISLEPATDPLWPESNLRQWEKEKFLGFAFVRFPDRFTVAVVPLWALIVVTTLLPLRWLTHPLRDRRTLFRHCMNCGYDLRGSVARCPECGQEFAPPPAALPSSLPIPRQGRARVERQAGSYPVPPHG